MFLTKSNTFIIGQVALLLGLLMNGIFIAQSAIGLANIGLCIILFTLVVYLLMTPLTIQQQKFSKLSAKMNPEIQAVQKKYKGKTNDPAVAQKMNEETQAIYAKYGVNPAGSCLQLVIQMPILFALYRVIWNIPAYVTKVRDAFTPLVTELMSTKGAESFLTDTAKTLNVSFKEMTDLTVVDVLYKFKPANWTALSEQFPNLSDTIAKTQKDVDHMNYFLGLNIADSPMNILQTGIKTGAILLVIGAILIPVLAAVTQWLNAKLMGTANQAASNTNGGNDAMANSMKTMNTVMPLMSAFFCLTLPVGLGLYWIAGAVIRSVQQVLINKKLDSMDIDEIMKANMEKYNKKREKMGLTAEKMNSNARLNTKNIDASAAKAKTKKDLVNDAASISENAAAAPAGKAKPGSLAEKARMVQDFNNNHKK